ncbi:MAG TPA: hypothetical protein VM577_07090 [Anaerovoracaceae bacterium]|nr:hypothetical protein [Anaerovoracaceae bacterium]
MHKVNTNNLQDTSTLKGLAVAIAEVNQFWSLGITCSMSEHLSKEFAKLILPEQQKYQKRRIETHRELMDQLWHLEDSIFFYSDFLDEVSTGQHYPKDFNRHALEIHTHYLNEWNEYKQQLISEHERELLEATINTQQEPTRRQKI